MTKTGLTHKNNDSSVARVAITYLQRLFLTCYGIQFTNHARHKYAFHHIFDRVCDENGIEHRLTKINHPWTNGQVERMTRCCARPAAEP